MKTSTSLLKHNRTPLTNRKIVLLLAVLCLSTLPFAAYGEPDNSEGRNMESFEIIWSTVNQHHFDPDFGGIDWTALRGKYAERMQSVNSDEVFPEIANQMLGELGLSHYAVFRTDQAVDNQRSGTVGVNVRILDHDMVVTAVKPGSPADKAGIRVGYVVESIDNLSLNDFAEDCERKMPGTNHPRLRLKVERSANDAFLGPTGTVVLLTYRDATDTLQRVLMRRAERSERIVLQETLPPFYLEFEARRLKGNIAYIAFNMFLPPVAERFTDAIRGMGDACGLIIDIRGNSGGMPAVGEKIAAQLIRRRTLFYLYRYRDRIEKVFIEPDHQVFEAPVVILIDGQNASSSERFTGCMQSIGRAVVVGERSSGAVGPASTMKLPNGTTLMYLLAQSLTPDGQVLEGCGVEPDIVVGYDREVLLAGGDSQLEKAIEYILP